MAPDLAPLPGWARVLPREFRERVVEPAWADLRLGERPGVSRAQALRARAILLLESLRVGLPQYVWHRGRPTRAARVGVVLAALLAVAVMRILYARAHWPAGR